jgi:hypothetical protein
MMSYKSVILPCLLLSASLSAGASESLKTILAQQQQLRTTLESDRTTGLTPRQLKVVRNAQADVFALTKGKSTLEEMNIEDKVRLENALERINAEIKGTRLSSEEKQVCWRERKSGSKLMVTRCGTQAEIDQAREGARAWMEKPKICVPPGCG